MFDITRQNLIPTWSGLKCPPAARQFSLVFPTAWTWNPWRPVSSPATLPWILMCAPTPPIMLGHWGGWVMFSIMLFDPYLLNVQGTRDPTAGLQSDLSTCDPNHLKTTSSCWQSMAIKSMAMAIQSTVIHVWPGESTSSQYDQKSSKPKDNAEMMRMLGKCAASSCFKANVSPLSGCTTSLQFRQWTSFCQCQPYQQCLKWSCCPKQCNGGSVMLTRLLKRNSQSLKHSGIDPVCLLGVSNGDAFMTGIFSCCLICDKSCSHWSAQFL